MSTRFSQTPPSATANRQLLAWHDWHLWLPADWNPVRVQGDRDNGSILIADMAQARLGLRWTKVSSRLDPLKHTRSLLKSEVGELAASEAKDLPMADAAAWRAAKLYTEREPPGRDVFVGWSAKSNRVLEIVHHLKQRDRFFEEQLLPTVSDQTIAVEKGVGPQAWSIFDLSCETQAGWQLQWFRLNAGDLSLAFRNRRETLVLRQVGPATLALARQPLDEWVGQQDKSIRKLYRPLADMTDVTIDLGDRSLAGRRGTFRRRRRLWWAFVIPRRLTTLGLHDTARNRLLIARGESEPSLIEALKTVGFANFAQG